MRLSSRLFPLALFVAGCGGGSGANDGGADLAAGPDLAMCKPDPTFNSECGKPCDRGNSLGVGRFCNVISDCKDDADTFMAYLCATIGDKDQHFCLMGCTVNSPPGFCGENARCACKGNQCGCFPTACDGPPPDGGKTD